MFYDEVLEVRPPASAHRSPCLIRGPTHHQSQVHQKRHKKHPPPRYFALEKVAHEQRNRGWSASLGGGEEFIQVYLLPGHFILPLPSPVPFVPHFLPNDNCQMAPLSVIWVPGCPGPGGHPQAGCLGNQDLPGR